MDELNILNRTSKGITPVIAVVLLLLVTVGAVGTIYAQFEGLVQDPDTGFLEDVDVNVQTVTRNDSHDPNSMSLRVQNSGQDEYNMSELVRMEYSVPGEGRLEKEVATSAFGEIEETGNHECFTSEVDDELQSFGPGTTASCDTGVSMVSPDDEVTLHLVERSSGDEIESYTCSPSTSSSRTC